MRRPELPSRCHFSSKGGISFSFGSTTALSPELLGSANRFREDVGVAFGYWASIGREDVPFSVLRRTGNRDQVIACGSTVVSLIGHQLKAAVTTGSSGGSNWPGVRRRSLIGPLNPRCPFKNDQSAGKRRPLCRGPSH